MSISAFILEDEPRAANVLKRMLQTECNNIDQLWHFSDLSSGQAGLNSISPTLAFVDIHLPDGNGFELVSTLKQKGAGVIFTSAHSEYAIKALRQKASDYLLKPYSLGELKSAISRTLELLQKNKPKNVSAKIALQTEQYTHLIDLNNLVFCKAERNYTTVYLNKGNEILISKTLKEFEKGLLEYGFIRVHRSYLVNAQFIVGLEKQDGGSLVLQKGEVIPISVRRKKEVLALIKILSGYTL